MLTRKMPEPLATIVATIVVVIVILGILAALQVSLGPLELVLLVVLLGGVVFVAVRSLLRSRRTDQGARRRTR